MDLLYTAWQLTALALGGALGSFMALAVVRIPEDASLVSPPSRCPVCHTSLRWHDNIPVVSWLLLRGRCAHCGAPISPMYPLIELTMALVTWLTFHRFVPNPNALDVQHFAAWVVFTIFAWCLLLAAYCDVRARIIPEIASIYAVPVGVLGTLLLDVLSYDGWLAIGWRASVVGVVVGGGFLGIISAAWYRIFGTEGLAWGDVRLMAMIGAFVGAVPAAWVILMLASFTGALLAVGALVVTRRPGYLPFGPALALSSLVYLLYGDVLVPRFLPGLSVFL